MHTFSEHLSGCPQLPDQAQCWALGRERPRCTEFLPLVGGKVAGSCHLGKYVSSAHFSVKVTSVWRRGAARAQSRGSPRPDLEKMNVACFSQWCWSDRSSGD